MHRSILGVDFDDGTASEILAAARAGTGRRARLVVTANLDHVVTLSENADFRRAYDMAAARTLDGMWLVWLAHVLGAPHARRVTGHDLLAAAMDAPDLGAERIYLVCATDAVAASMARRLAARGVPGEAIAASVPPFGFEADASYSLDLARRVRDHGTTLLVLGVGAPRSEVWVERHASILGDVLALAVGDALNVAAGTMRRAPAWMRDNGFEWLYRFSRSPRHLFRRYFVRSWRILGIAWGMRAGARGRGALALRPRRRDGSA